MKERQDKVMSAAAWFIWKILVEKQYTDKLGTVPSAITIDAEKTSQYQYPAHTMHLKASTNDDNIAIIKNLEKQIGTDLVLVICLIMPWRPWHSREA